MCGHIRYKKAKICLSPAYWGAVVCATRSLQSKVNWLSEKTIFFKHLQYIQSYQFSSQVSNCVMCLIKWETNWFGRHLCRLEKKCSSTLLMGNDFFLHDSFSPLAKYVTIFITESWSVGSYNILFAVEHNIFRAWWTNSVEDCLVSYCILLPSCFPSPHFFRQCVCVPTS